MRISDWSSDVCSSDLLGDARLPRHLPLDLLDVLAQRGELTPTPGELQQRPGRCRHQPSSGAHWTRSADSREGKECVSKSGYRWSPDHVNKTKKRRTERMRSYK